MRRRTFIRAFACGVVIALVGKSHAQSKTASIGFLHAASPQPSRLAAFERGLNETGFSVGAFSALVRRRPDGLFVAPDSYYSTRREQLSRLAATHRLPAVHSVRDYVEEGGLMSYGPSITDMFYRVGIYTGRVLAGRKPAELPVEQLNHLELVVNGKTAKALGVTIPQALLVRADEVIW
jgi:ABC-type uncharacterized transport system substrate-binding protein